MLFTLAIYALFSLFILLVDYSLPKAILTVFVGIAMLVGFALAGLWIRNLMERAYQTVTALAGTGIVFDAINLPLVLLSSTYPPEQLVLPLFLLYLTLIWNISVISHIFKNALSIPFWAGIFLALIYAVVYTRVIGILLATGNTATPVS